MPELSPREAAKRIIGQKRIVRDTVEALSERGHSSEIRGSIGDPADEILHLLEEVDADFVVVGGRDRSQTREALFGSVSQEVIRGATCPVVSIRNTSR